jgi:hypothetical protein
VCGSTVPCRPTGGREGLANIHAVDLVLHSVVGCVHRVVSVLEDGRVALGLEGDVPIWVREGQLLNRGG